MSCSASKCQMRRERGAGTPGGGRHAASLSTACRKPRPPFDNKTEDGQVAYESVPTTLCSTHHVGDCSTQTQWRQSINGQSINPSPRPPSARCALTRRRRPAPLWRARAGLAANMGRPRQGSKTGRWARSRGGALVRRPAHTRPSAATGGVRVPVCTRRPGGGAAARFHGPAAAPGA